MRALFQILIGMATQSTVASTISAKNHGHAEVHPWRRQIEDASLTELAAEYLPDDLESDRRGQQNHDPVNLKPPHQPPHVSMEVGEEQRREVPDRFLRADLTQAAAGESAADGKGQAR